MFDQNPAQHDSEFASSAVYAGGGDLRSTQSKRGIVLTGFYSRDARRMSTTEVTWKELAVWIEDDQAHARTNFHG